jgi:hypothetical protein
LVPFPWDLPPSRSSSQWAIALAWDMIARFGHDRLGNGEALPDEFFDDL